MIALAFIYTAVSSLTVAIYSIISGRSAGGIIVRTVAAGILGLVVYLFTAFCIMPPLMGSFWGHGLLLFELALVIGLVGLIDSFADDSDNAAKLLTAIAVVVALAVPVVNFTESFVNSFGASNAGRRGRLLAETLTDKVPDTDPNHMVLVSKEMAFFAATQLMGSTGKASVYRIDQDSESIQVIRGHAYYAFTVIPLGVSSQLGFFQEKITDGLGYVLVSAEQPDQTPQLIERKLKYREDAIFNHNAIRAIYNAGYTDGELVDPSLEISENGTPFITVTLMKPAFGNYFKRIAKVILLNMETGEITPYSLNEVPAWVDRIVPADYAVLLASEWGKWGNDKSLKFWNFTGSVNEFQSRPAVEEPLLLITDTGHSVWVVPMTSINKADNSAQGLLLIDTKVSNGQVHGSFYTQFKGVPVGPDVEKKFEGAIPNLAAGSVSISSIQYYRLNGSDAWVAIYEQKQHIGASLYGYAVLPVHNVSGSAVRLVKDRRALVQEFDASVNSRGNGGSISTQGSAQKFNGTILGVAKVFTGGNTGVDTLVQITINSDQNHIYQASAKDWPWLSFAKPGQAISGTYNKTLDDSAIRQINSINGSAGRH